MTSSGSAGEVGERQSISVYFGINHGEIIGAGPRDFFALAGFGAGHALAVKISPLSDIFIGDNEGLRINLSPCLSYRDDLAEVILSDHL